MNINPSKEIAKLATKNARAHKVWRGIVHSERNNLVQFSNACFYRIDPVTRKQIPLTGFHSFINGAFARNSNIMETMVAIHAKYIREGILQRPIPAVSGTSRAYGPSF